MTTILPQELAKKLGEMVDDETQMTDEALMLLGWDAISIITLRTKGGRDADGNTFVPYSEQYAAMKVRKGWGNTPTLALTGQMLGGMVPAVTGTNEVAIQFSSEFDARKAAWNDETRNFFDVRSEDELSLLAESMLEQVGK